MIDYGERLRIGMLVPSGNVIIEPQVNAMLPPGVALYVTRLPLRGSGEAELLAMAENVEEAARLLAHAGVGLIAFNCTAVSTYSKALEGEIKRRIGAASGVPALPTSEALVEALRALNARKVVLLTPYLREVNEREVAFLQRHGFEVLAEAGDELDRDRQAFAVEEPRMLRDPQRQVEIVARNRADGQCSQSSAPKPRTRSWTPPARRQCQVMAWLLVTTGRPSSRSSVSMTSAERTAVQLTR